MRRHLPLLVFASLPALVANAAPTVSADALIERGIGLREKRQFQEALDLFQRAHARAPSAKTLAQIGLTEANLKRWVDAETHLGAALSSHDTPWIESTKNRDAIKEALGLVRTHVCLVSVVGPAGAEIAIGGAPVGRLPFPAPIHVGEGRARVEGSADGRQAASIDLFVPGGHELTVHLDLPLLPAPDAPPAAAAQAAPPSLLDNSAVPEASSWKTWTGGGLVAVSAGLIGTGIVWVALDGDNVCSPSAGERCLRVYDTRTQGLIAVGAGAVAGVVGGILLWQGHQSDMRVGVGLGTFTASGTF